MGELYRTDLVYLAVLKYIIRHTSISNSYFIIVAIYVIGCKVKAQPPDLVGAKLKNVELLVYQCANDRIMIFSPYSIELRRATNSSNFSISWSMLEFFRRHRCPHNLPQDHLEIPRDGPVHAVTSYREEFDEKHVDRQTVYHHEDHLRMEGEFIGERRTDYVVTRGERAPVRKPQDNLKPEGEFIGRPKEEAPTKGEKAPVKKPQDNLKPEGEFIGRPKEEAPKYGDRTPVRRPQDNLRSEGDFDSELRF